MPELNRSTQKRLGSLADQIDAQQVELDRLYAERTDLWIAASTAGVSAVEISKASRVKPGAVRQWMFRRARQGA